MHELGCFLNSLMAFQNRLESTLWLMFAICVASRLAIVLPFMGCGAVGATVYIGGSIS